LKACNIGTGEYTGRLRPIFIGTGESGWRSLYVDGLEMEMSTKQELTMAVTNQQRGMNGTKYTKDGYTNNML